MDRLGLAKWYFVGNDECRRKQSRRLWRLLCLGRNFAQRGLFFESTYKWCKGAENTQTKYCSDSELGIVDNKKTLDPDDDAATINWGPSWRMPTEAQMQELITRCNWKASTMNGVKGYSVTGPNGATMFLPAASCRGDGPIDDTDWGGFYWSSESPGFIDAAGGLTFGEGGASWAFLYRFGGCSVRPVRVLDK